MKPTIPEDELAEMKRESEAAQAIGCFAVILLGTVLVIALIALACSTH